MGWKEMTAVVERFKGVMTKETELIAIMIKSVEKMYMDKINNE